jgi:hypothetical protein
MTSPMIESAIANSPPMQRANEDRRDREQPADRRPEGSPRR